METRKTEVSGKAKGVAQEYPGLTIVCYYHMSQNYLDVISGAPSHELALPILVIDRA